MAADERQDKEAEAPGGDPLTQMKTWLRERRIYSPRHLQRCGGTQMEGKDERMSILALAGRRIDAPGADPRRFPLSNVPVVRKRMAELFVTENATAVVCSAACGADLIALEAARELGLRQRVVLPFVPERFRETSVVDRPGDWGEIYDRVIAGVEAKGDLVVLPPMTGDANDAYQAANEAIIREAEKLTGPGERLAVIVWEGTSRSGSDATEVFRTLTEAAGFSQRFILTV